MRELHRGKIVLFSSYRFTQCDNFAQYLNLMFLHSAVEYSFTFSMMLGPIVWFPQRWDLSCVSIHGPDFGSDLIAVSTIFPSASVIQIEI